MATHYNPHGRDDAMRAGGKPCIGGMNERTTRHKYLVKTRRISMLIHITMSSAPQHTFIQTGLLRKLKKRLPSSVAAQSRITRNTSVERHSPTPIVDPLHIALIEKCADETQAAEINLMSPETQSEEAGGIRSGAVVEVAEKVDSVADAAQDQKLKEDPVETVAEVSEEAV